MITRKQFDEAREKAVSMMAEAGIKLTGEEIKHLDVADFGLGHLEVEGAQIAALVDTERLSIRLIALFPGQTEPEHWHTAVGDKPGKEETVRILSGTVRFYLPGPEDIKEGFIPQGKEEWYTCRHEMVMQPGSQLTISPGTPHWFQAAGEGAVLICFCSTAVDAMDPFTDPSVIRVTKIIED